MGKFGDRRGLRRRDLLVASSGVLVVPWLGSCDAISLDPEGDEDDRPDQQKGPEAPMLAERVEAGELPPVEERLPDEPLVVEPVDRVGVYGGEWRTALEGTADNSWLERTSGLENLVAWESSIEWAGELGEVVPNLTENFEVNEEATEFTFKLRPGIRWSDGEPFTADDIVFAQNDVSQNEELFPSQSVNPATAEKVDDYTVKISFEEPDGLFLQDQATQVGGDLVMRPMHYLRQFHADYNENIDELIEEEDAEDWVDLFMRKSGADAGDIYWQNSEMPTLRAWKVVTALGDGQRVVLERNPYYWKVDPDGSQLPYIDRIVYDVVQDPEAMLLKAQSGEIDMHARHFNSLRNKPALAETQEEGKYEFLDLISPDAANSMIIHFNQTHQNNVLREVFRSKDFRIGLSHAINRQEIIDAVLQGQGEPAQHTPFPDTPFYDEEMAKQYVEYDVDLANDYLDRVVPDKDSSGIRLYPDGERLSFPVDTLRDFLGVPLLDILDLVRGYWREVGIDMNLNNIERSYFQDRQVANEHTAAVWVGQGARDVVIRPGDFVPATPVGNVGGYGVLWADWYQTNGQEGEEPPEEVRRQQELYRQITTTTEAEEQAELMSQVLEISKDQFYTIGISMFGESYGIVKNNFHNVPQTMVEAYVYNTPAGPGKPEQYFMTDED